MVTVSRRQRHPLASNKRLLHIFMAAAFLVALSIIIFIPQNIENETLLSHHGVKQLTAPRRHADAAIIGKQQIMTLEEKMNRKKPNDMTTTGAKQQPPPPPPLKLAEEESSDADTDAEDNSHDLNDKDDDKKLIPSQVSYHLVFSTGCSIFQDWQSYVFFYHAVHSGQEGQITRVVSGCNDKDAEQLKRVFSEEIEPMAPGRLHLHFTPDFSHVKEGVNFKYFNKPFGTKHWMDHALGYPSQHIKHDDSIVILMDPDQILLRPFTNDFTNSSERWRLKDGYKLKVEHGSPFSQQYGYGLQWLRKVTAEHVFAGKPSPVANITDKEAFDYYMGMGPPYVATAKDMYAIASTWSEVVPRVHDEYPHLLAEMFGFNLAAAHLGLRHTVAHSFMVSDVRAGGEGWKLIDAIPAKDVCHNFPKSEYPHVIHYCQRYYLGKWFIGKYRLRKDFISCEAPLLMVPPDDIALTYTSAFTPDGNFKILKKTEVKEEAFMVCVMINSLNSAAVYYKDHHCDKETANYEYSYTFHEDMTMPEPEEDEE
jgi:hypothetical protein